MSHKKVAVLASAALAASSVLLIAQPASGALVTNCRGEGGAVTVPGDLVVPRGASCVLTGTTVTGNIRVAADADLAMEGVTVNGELRVNNNAYADVYGDSVISGDVRVVNAFGVYIEESTLEGNVLQNRNDQAAPEPFVYLFSTGVAGGVDSRAGEVLLQTTQIQGPVSARNGLYADIIDSTLESTLRVQNNELGSVVCEVEVYGDATFVGNSSTLQIGGSGAGDPCEGASFWNGDVSFVDNTASDTGFDISNNIVRGDLTGSGNDPLPTGAGNRVRGDITLEFAAADDEGARVSLQSQSAESVETGSEAAVVVDERVAEVTAKVESRRASALAGAAAVPSAQALSPAPQG